MVLLLNLCPCTIVLSGIIKIRFPEEKMFALNIGCWLIVPVFLFVFDICSWFCQQPNHEKEAKEVRVLAPTLLYTRYQTERIST